MHWWLDAGDAEQRGWQVDEADRPIHGSGELVTDQVPVWLRHPDQEGHVQAALRQEALGAGDCAAVVAVIEHDGAVREAIRLQSVEDLPDLAVEFLEPVVVDGVVVARRRGVGVKRRQLYVSRVVVERGAAAVQAALVRGPEVGDMEERLVLGAVAVAGLRAAVVPGVRLIDGVVVLLGVVGGGSSRPPADSVDRTGSPRGS